VLFAANGAEFLMPSDTMLLLAYGEYACHCMKLPDVGSRTLRWIMDVHPMLRLSEQLRWDDVISAAKTRALTRQVRLLLETYGSFAPRQIPEDIPDRLCTKASADNLFRLLSAYGSSHSKAQRLWLSCRLAAPDKPAAAIVPFLKKLRKALAARVNP